MDAQQLIAALDLAPHPEGGWFRETWRAAAADGERAAASAVLYLIQPGQRSHWNRVDAHEIWLWHQGDPVDLRIADGDDGPVRTVRLGGDVIGGEQVQVVIAAGQWQSAEPAAGEAGYALVSCIVAPAFEFAGFELAAPRRAGRRGRKAGPKFTKSTLQRAPTRARHCSRMFAVATGAWRAANSAEGTESTPHTREERRGAGRDRRG
jgi:predicted cupin superfamily sugar epimerase